MEENLFEDSENIEDISIEDSIKTSYLDYSMSVIIGRALPDARDGLKPVHRRILYAMNELNLSSKAPYKKSARIVGDVIGKYHPHGDTAVYDALVRMAQPFSMRLPLIDGQGNFGSIDGDNPAAMRYTEARMTNLAEELLKDIDKDTVDFVPNYDDSMSEPDVLPTRVPNLLLNGSSGIAVGMATNIPPHNLGELIDALLFMIDNKEVTIDDIISIIKGPDFPTAGVIFGKKGIKDAYETGRGRIRIRAKTHIETVKNKEIIVVDELPYQVNKARLIEIISNLVKDKQLDGVSLVRDESDREGMRVVIELKKDAMSEIVLNNLYKSTTMEITFGVILLAIVNKEPKIFTLVELLNLFLSHRKTVIIRRTIYELEKAKARAHILEGLKIALDNIDKVIKVIKASKDTQEAKDELMSIFGLSLVQASAILDMKLQRLTGLEKEKIENELKALREEIEKLLAILKSEKLLNNLIKKELTEIKSKFSTPRLTEIVDNYNDIDIEDLIPNEPMVITITHRGYIKRVSLKQYEKQNRGGKGKTAVTTYDDDFIENFFISNTHNTLMFVTDRGQLYWLKVYKIPEGSRTAKGKAVVNLINLQPEETIKTIIPTTDFDGSKSLAFFTKNGTIKRTNLSEFKNIRSAGVKAITLEENNELVNAAIISSEDKFIFMVTKKGMCIRFKIEDVREMGRSAKGVAGIKFKVKGDEVIGGIIIENEEQEILALSQKGIGKRTEVNEYREQRRGGTGVIAMKLTPKTKDLVGVVSVNENKDLMALTSTGKMIRVDMQTIRKARRNTSGVIVVKTEGKDVVVDIAKAPKEEEVKPDKNVGVEE
jgi:DNA gyrase subunit A